MDLGDWLQRLGLGQYAAAFRDHQIDDAVLPTLTSEDLRDLGVGLVGHRRKLLDAIAALRVKADISDPLSDAPEVAVEAAVNAERRQVTVMFSDLVGSTALSVRMDPEDLREIIAAYQQCVANTVRRFAGFVAKYMGDGVLIYFGYPTAHEDDAERAVRAGLALINAVSTLPTPETLQVRIGVATGLVVVGDLVGTGEAQERSIVGETPNLAARLQAIAEPNTVVIADATRKLLGNLYELRDIGAKELKGISGPVRAFVALRASSVASRFEAMHPSGLTALIGREEELELLLRRWARAKSGDGQVALVSGEAGIGKSRLTAGLMEAIAAESHVRLRYFCSPQHTDSAFYPIIGQFERAAGFAVGDTAAARLEKLDRLLARTRTSQQDAALIAEMLSLRNDGRFPVLELGPEQRRQKTLEALGTQLQTLARSNPLLMIVEDAHWADPTSLEAFGRTVDLVPSVPILMIVTYRPEFEAPWIGQPHVTVLALNRLGHREVGSMIDCVVGDKALPVDVRKAIIERTDGIPLFVEEMTKAVLETGGELEAMQIAAAVPSPALAVPPSLHASLMARLDRLGPAKELAQIGAAIGRVFSHALLSAVTSKTDAELDLALDRLIAAGLLFRQGMSPNVNYLFKHALVQDAAYGTLLRGPRRVLHARIADTLETKFVEVIATQPQLLAHHCTEAGLIQKAARLWGDAGQQSLARSALIEAAAQLTRALNQITGLPTTTALRREQIKFQVALANVMMHTKGYAAPETKAAVDQARVYIDRAEALGEPPEDPLLLFSVLYGSWVASFVSFKGDICSRLARDFLSLAENKDEKAMRMIGHRLTGSALLLTGEIAKARMHYDQAIAVYDPDEHRTLAMRFGQDTEVACLSFRSVAQWLLGYPEAALADTERALRTARSIGQATTLMFALRHVSVTCIQCGAYEAASAQIDELVALADEKGASLWRALATVDKGYVFTLTGRPRDAVQMITSGIGVARSTGSTVFMQVDLSYLALAYAALDQFEESWDCLDKAFTASATTKAHWWEAETSRIAGEVGLMSPVPDIAKSEAYFDRALAISRAQQAKSWELRAAMSMARLWHEQGKRDEARQLLAPVYGWFTEGFDTPDLKQAKTLLEELG
ncbi:Adenylate cyclase 1 [Bradyrhizobium ivorense]|uniref:Adenylate cyclase 1 n=1 Tax=Bradyrhizobium ivorense TaxID=2511166 RepID=A0A508TNX2_9BRAD|nr:adenylate/guanylate cyclase domain-containing protein [Bradyrhizobium ivorense]VIO76021.1 Adenylate cyclase 1 [Bradyrhizobium ivorense]